MKTILKEMFGVTVFIIVVSATWGQESPVADHQRKMQESSLHKRASESGGNLYQVRDASAEKLYNNLASLMKASDEVLLVHIDRNVCQLSPEGAHPITFYKATVLRKWKGLTTNSVTFALPMGLVIFDANTKAATSIRGFHSLENGGRYVVFLRFSSQEERQLTPALRLTGDAIQGAYEIENEKVLPAYHLDPIGHIYSGRAASEFLNDLQSLVVSQEKK